MPAPATVSEFLDVVRKSGLVPDDRAQAEMARLRDTSSPAHTVDHVAAAFVRAGLLTRFQSKQMKIGRYKRFEIAGKYRLLELLGVGGMGAVYLCEHTFMKRLVAVKILPADKLADPSALHRFYREARAVAALDHPNIVRAYDIDKFDQLHFLVMEFVDGTSLQEIVAQHGPLDPLRAANAVAQAAHGLHHAHELGMVHRDVKPGNLLLDRNGHVKVLDMGLARFFDQKHDDVTARFDNNCVLGTADYLAPEQAISNVVDVRADLYALGGSFYFLLTGRSPFPDGTIAHKLLAHQKKEPVPVEDFRDDVPAGLLVVLRRLMRKDPAERHQTPADLFAALAPWADGGPSPPPLHEMPDLCPAVLALTGHAAEKARAGSTRLLTAGGRTAVTSLRGGGSSLYPVSATPGPLTPPPGTALAPLQAAAETATAPSTEPLRSVTIVRPGESGAAAVPDAVPDPAGPAGRPPADVTGKLWLLVGVLAGLLLAVVAAGTVAGVWYLTRTAAP